MRTSIMWFRRDLRLTDNPALEAAAAADRMRCAFVLDRRILGSARMAPARVVYLRHALADLSASLAARGNRLIILEGDSVGVLCDLADRVDADEVHWSADHTPFAVSRDQSVGQALAARDIVGHAHAGVAIAPPGSVLTGAGSPYKVFTPFHRRWRERDHGTPTDAPDRLPPIAGDLTGPAIADHPLLRADGPEDGWPEGGETAARRRLSAWLADGVDTYHERRDLMAVDGTSRLSADLHFGCLSAREVWSRLDRRHPGQMAYATELAWRDFYLHVIAAWPDAAHTAFKPAYRNLAWHEDPQGFQAWADGQTGYPLIDAAMRQLRRTGWMHNRARMVVASFLCKDLLVDWRRGEAHFLAHLVDGDVSSNNGGWQWAAGTGTDAQPFFRIFNPVTQGTRFDPEGEYVRRFVPELREVPAPMIHSPWRLSESDQQRYGVRIGTDYPAPLVDHVAARDRALAWFGDQVA